MALTKVSRGLLSTGIVDNSNATAITLNSDESATFAGGITVTGNAGIDGQTSPNADLHIGTASAVGDATNPALQFGGSTTFRLGMYTDAEGGYIENKNGDNGLIFRVKTVGEAMRIDGGSGAVTKTNQPAFLVTKNANQNNIAANTDVVVTWTTEVFDVGSNFNTSTNVFDAPVSGKYQLSSNIRIDNIDSSANYCIVSIFTSNRLFRAVYSLNTLSADPVYWAFTLSITADMDAGDHAWVTVNQGGGSVQADIAGDVSYTQFSGYLLG